MPTWSFYDRISGLLAAHTVTVPVDQLAGNTPPGFAAIEGRLDAMSQRVELLPDDFGEAVVPVVVDYQPPPPADTEWETWAWDDGTRRYISSPTLVAVARDERVVRDRRLQACDWVVARAMEQGTAVPLPWSAYRQALRDITAQPGFPAAIDWPIPPTE